MHPKKEEMLKKLDDVSRIHDASLKRSVDISAVRFEQHRSGQLHLSDRMRARPRT